MRRLGWVSLVAYAVSFIALCRDRPAFNMWWRGVTR